MNIQQKKEEFLSVFEKLPIEKQEEIIDFTYFLDNQEKESSTNYLFSTEANKKHLNQAIDEVENGQNLIEVDLNELKKANLLLI